MYGWNPSPYSADQEILDDLPTLRGRSRSAFRNIPIAGGAINRMVINVTGANGLRPQSKVKWRELGISKDMAQGFQREAEAFFEAWASSKEADHERRLDFWQLQGLTLRSALDSGDCFAVKRFYPRVGSDFRLKIQLIEADRCDNPNHAADTDVLKMGVVKGFDGDPVAYWFADRYPTDPRGAGNWRKLPAFGAKSGVPLVLHILPIERVGQSRGVPYLAPVLELFKIIGGYTISESMSAAVASRFTAFITSKSGSFAADNPSIKKPDGKDRQKKIQLEQAAVIELKPDQGIEIANPGRPNANFGDFIDSVMEQAGSRLDQPIEVIRMHYTQSYTAARGALLAVVKTYSTRRSWIGKDLCQPCWEEVLTEKIASGELKAPGFFDSVTNKKRWLNATWHGDSFGLLDPLKETKAAVLGIDNNLTTLQNKVIEMSGQDWLDVHEQRVIEVTKAKEDGLTTDPEAAMIEEPKPVDEEGNELPEV